VFNQRKELVLEGMQKFLIRRRPVSSATGPLEPAKRPEN